MNTDDSTQFQPVGATTAAPADSPARQAAEAAVALDWKVGDVILNTYQVLDIFHGGGMGLVYRVHHRQWGIDMAVKAPRAEYFQSDAQRADFSRECEVWINLGLHPHIVSCHYVRTLGGVPRVFAEFVEGGSLKDWIEQRTLYEGGPERALARILDVAIQVLNGQAAAEALQDYLAGGGRCAKIPRMPNGVVALLRECFQRDPAQRPAGAGQVAERLAAVYREETGQPYSRPVPRAAELLADSLNNKALSLADLGKPQDAQAAWEVALRADAQHLESLYNLELWRWRSGQTTDLQVVEALQLAVATRPGDWQALYLLSQVHLERGDDEAALAALEQIQTAEAARPEVAAALAEVRKRVAGSARCLRVFRAHSDLMSSACLSGDGGLALSGGVDGTARLWGVVSGRCLRTFEGHTSWVTSVCLSRDGRLALSGSEDRTMRLWDVTGGRCLRTFEGHAGPVLSVSLSRDGRLVLSGSADKTVRLWQLDWELEYVEPADWDEEARPYLHSFLVLHTPHTGALPQDRPPSEEEITLALTRRGEPTWNEEDFQQLLDTLGCVGYGWLRPEGVRAELERMAQSRQGPPPLEEMIAPSEGKGSWLGRLFGKR